MPQKYSNAEFADIIYCYGFCDGNAEAASREYRRRFPNRERHPSPRVFTRSFIRFRATGSCWARNHENAPNANDHRRNNRILNIFDNDPTTSTRVVGRQIQVPQRTVNRILNRDGRHAFHYRPVQELLPEDYEKRVDFCRAMTQKVQDEPGFISRILWTDEATFTRRGITNFNNLHVWAHDNPRATKTRSFQHEFKVNVWMGFIDEHLCGPYFFRGTLDSAQFLRFLDENLITQLEDVPLNLLQNFWMQLDGAPAHYGRNVRRWLDEHFRGSWIGRGGPISWPPRSPDITPLDFAIWGYLKQRVYFVPINTLEQLTERINEATNDLRNNNFQMRKIQAEIRKRIQKCLDVEGGHFEQLLR